jgi:thiol-disulfide isomerase/thioredoxin
MLGFVIAVAVLAVATAGGLVYRARYGRLRGSTGRAVPAELLDLVDTRPGSVTLLHFSSATCAPCRQVRAVCAQLAGDLPHVQHVEIDAEEHLDAARALDVWRLPTLLVVDGSGQITRRAVGVPDRATLTAAVTEVLTP